MTTTAKLSLPLVEAAQAQKHVTHNEAINLLDQIVQAAVVSRTLTAPPGSPSVGAAYIPAASASGAWSGRTGQIAAWRDGVWTFLSPQTGWLVWCVAEARILVWTGTAWADALGLLAQTLQGVQLLGLNTTADTTNRLAAKINAALFAALTTAEGGTGDLRFTLNKAAAANTVSQLYQDNFSGRAETGLTGDDNFHIKVSSDGTTWREAININAATGVATLLQLALTNALAIAQGGTGATTAAGALSSLGAAPLASPSFTGTANFANTPAIGGTALSSLYARLAASNTFGNGADQNITITSTSGSGWFVSTAPGGMVLHNTANADTVMTTNGIERLRLTSTGQITAAGPIKAASYTVATLPAAGTAGRIVSCSNARMFNGTGTLEGAGAGTGGLVVDNGSGWKIAGTNVTATA